MKRCTIRVSEKLADPPQVDHYYISPNGETYNSWTKALFAVGRGDEVVSIISFE